MKHKKMSENFVNQWLQAYDKVDMNVDSWRVALKLRTSVGLGHTMPHSRHTRQKHSTKKSSSADISMSNVQYMHY